MKAPETGVLARAFILMAALTLTCLLLGGCGSARAAATPARTTSAASAMTVSADGTPGSVLGSVFGRMLGSPAATVTGGRVG